MTWTVQTIHHRLVDLDESDRIEGKSGLGAATHKSISAFSNEVGMRGGYIVFGVRRLEDGSPQTVGVADPDTLQTDLASQCRSVFNRTIDVDIRVERVGGQRVVVAFIPEAKAEDKPVYIKKQGLPKGAYRRIGSSDCVATDADLARFASLAQSLPFDLRLVPGGSRNDIEPAALSAYRQQVRASRPGSELLLMSDNELLSAVGALRNAELTFAGLVLFGSKLAIRRLRPSLRVDIITTDDSELADSYHVVEVREALVTGWQRVFQAIADTLPKRVTLTNDTLKRTEVARIPELVLREAVVNALIHRDLEVPSPIQVRRYPDRVEIDNPGYSLAAKADWEQRRSVARNPTVAQAFTELDLAETRGTGMRRMQSRMKGAGLPAPTLDSDREGNWFKLTLSFHHRPDEADWTWLKRFADLDDVDRQVLVMARDGRVRNEEVRAVSGEDTLATSNRLARLRDAGLLTMHGRSKAHTWYTLAPAAQPVAGDTADLRSQDHPQHTVDNPSHLTEQPFAPHRATGRTSQSNPSHLTEQPVAPHRATGRTSQSNPSHLTEQPVAPAKTPLGTAQDPLPAHAGRDSTHDDPLPTPADGHARVSPPPPVQPDMPPEFEQRLSDLPKRPTKQQVEGLILALCTLGWWEPDQLARKLGRHRRYLVQTYLQPMVSDGRLQRKYPDRRHHPRQAYAIAPGEPDLGSS